MSSAAIATADPRERGILFTGPNVLKILAGTKTQTRRIVKWRPCEEGLNVGFSGLDVGLYNTANPKSGWVLRSRDGAMRWNDRTYPLHCPYGSVRDRLWVRETFSLLWPDDCEDGLIYDDAHPDGRPLTDRECEIAYRASGDAPAYDEERDAEVWRPSIHMPRWASRLTLDITDVRVERLWDISDADVVAEGIRKSDAERRDEYVTYRSLFVASWKALHGPESWEANPWVWAITFARLP